MRAYRLKYDFEGYIGQMTVEHFSSVHAVACCQERVIKHLFGISPFRPYPVVHCYIRNEKGVFISWLSEEAADIS